MRQISISPRRNQTIAILKPGIIDSLAIAAISGYQRYLSPHKGFRCAHRVLHQGESCSQYVKRKVQEDGFVAALRSSRRRFAECKEANLVIQERRRNYLLSLAAGTSLAIAANTNVAIKDETLETPPTEAEDNSFREQENQSGSNDAAGSSNCNEFDGSCIEVGCDVANCLSVVDVGTCDLAGLDCSGVDACSGLDACGSCSW
jgi:putative component of membrane protein insertase Oxa1/YidC/SpoIIIJ protein YidD